MSKEKENQVVKLEDSKKFPAVLTKSFFYGVEQGTELRFDFGIGKYVSVSESEEIGPGDSYYYSGSAIAIDPYIVRQAIDVDFVYVESESKPELEGTSTTKKSEPEVWDVADLVSICGQCGKVTKVATYDGGVQWIIVTRSDSIFEIKCLICESKMTLTFQNGRAFTDAELEEKKKKLSNKEKYDNSKLTVEEHIDSESVDKPDSEPTFEEKMEEIAKDKKEKLENESKEKGN